MEKVILLRNTESNLKKYSLALQNTVFLNFLCSYSSLPSCLALKGLELGISLLKNVEAVKEENQLILWKSTKRVVFAREIILKELLPTSGQIRLKFCQWNFMVLLLSKEFPYFSEQKYLFCVCKSCKWEPDLKYPSLWTILVKGQQHIVNSIVVFAKQKASQ